MATACDKMLEQAMSLPLNERLALVEKLIESLNLPTQSEIDRAWAEEAERRIRDLDEGTVKHIPGEQVFEEIRERFSR